MTIENRSITSAPVLNGDEQKYCEGYAFLFYDGSENTEYRSNSYVERISPDVKVNGKFVYACLNHDVNTILDHTESTLTLTPDNKGLHYKFPLYPDDPTHKVLGAKLKNKQIKGASYSMTNVVDSWTKEGNNRIRNIKSFDLLHVSPTYHGCYPGASAKLRSAIDNDVEKELEIAYLKFETEKRINKK